MRTSVLCTALAALAAAPLAAGAQATAASTRYTLAGDSVAVYDLAGTVKIVAGTGSAVTVDVPRAGTH